MLRISFRVRMDTYLCVTVVLSEVGYDLGQGL